MVFVYTFAVGGGSGKVVDFPNWALVRSCRLASECLQADLISNVESHGQSRLLHETHIGMTMR